MRNNKDLLSDSVQEKQPGQWRITVGIASCFLLPRTGLKTNRKQFALGFAPFFYSLTVLNFPLLFLLIPGLNHPNVLLFYPPD